MVVEFFEVVVGGCRSFLLLVTTNKTDKRKSSIINLPPTQHQSFFRNYSHSLQNTLSLICLSLKKNSVCCFLTLSSENAGKFKQ